MPFFGLAKSVGFCGIPWHSPWRVCWGIPQAIKEIESSVMALLEREGLGTFMDKKAIRLVTGWPQNWSTWMMINRKSNGLGCILGNHASAARGWKEKTFRGWIPLHAFWCSDSLKFWKAQHMSKHQTAPKSPKACNRGGPYGPYGGGPWYDISGCTPQDCIAAAHQPGFDRSNRESPWVGVEYRVSVLADLWYICGERYRWTYRHSVGCSRSSWLGIQISKLVLELFSQKDLILIQIQTLRLTFGFFTKQALSFGIKFRDSKFAATMLWTPEGIRGCCRQTDQFKHGGFNVPFLEIALRCLSKHERKESLETETFAVTSSTPAHLEVSNISSSRL